jgi:hypothetical protein
LSPEKSSGGLTAAILRDRERADTQPSQNIVDCISCGASFIYRPPQGDDSGRFCSPRCREWYDNGNSSYDQHYASKNNPLWYTWRSISASTRVSAHDARPMPMGPHGFIIACAGCGKNFDSKGLRCCSADCERQYRERKDNAAVMAEVGMEPASTKRKCENPGCGKSIPKWRNGKRVSKSTRFCSQACQRKCWKAAEVPGPRIAMP